MRLILSLAFRNALRNRRRSLLTATTVLLGTALATVGLAWVLGVYTSFIQTGTEAVGEVRVVTRDYIARESLQPLYANIPSSKALVAALEAAPGVTAVYPRVSAGVAASQGGEEIGEVFGLMVGAPVGYYDQILQLRPHITQGAFFSDDPAVAAEEGLVGQGLAREMGAKVGETAYFLGQTQDGSLSAIKVKVVGLVDTGNSLFDRQVYVSLDKARYLVDLPDGAIEVLVFGTDPGHADDLSAQIQPLLAAQEKDAGVPSGALLAQAWDAREPWAGILVMLRTILFVIGGVIVFIFALGVLNTMLMSVLERTAEIGVLRAMGLKLGGVVVMFVSEALAIAAAGGLVGTAIGSLAAIYLEAHGLDLGAAADKMPATLPVNRIVSADWSPSVALLAFGLGLLMALVGSASPALRAARIQPVQAMRARR